MSRMIRWIFLAVILLLIPAKLPLAQEQTSQNQRAQSDRPSGEYNDIQQQIQLEKQQDETVLRQYALQQMEVRHKTAKYNALMGVIAFAITILGILAIITLVFIARARKEQRRRELIGQYLEKGQVVPSELLAGTVVGGALSTEQWNALIRLRSLRWGTWLLCLGLGIGLAIYFWSGNLKYTLWCLILLFLSIGFYINALFFSGKSDSTQK
jgi:hypothetical protein